jgi:hypothetical protein
MTKQINHSKESDISKLNELLLQIKEDTAYLKKWVCLAGVISGVALLVFLGMLLMPFATGLMVVSGIGLIYYFHQHEKVKTVYNNLSFGFKYS